MASRDVASQLVEPERILLIDNNEANLAAGSAAGFHTHRFTSLEELRKFLSSNPLQLPLEKGESHESV